jgi:hypothetical protein
MTDTELMLSAIRSAVLRCDLDKTELNTVGIALKADMITLDDAVAWLADAGLIDQVVSDTGSSVAA